MAGWIIKLEGARGTRYKAGWRGPDRRARYRTFRRKRDAEAYLASVEHAANMGTYVDPTLGRVTLSEFWKHFWRTSKPPAASTQALYEMQARVHILPRLGGRPIASLTKPDIRDFLATLREEGVGLPTVAAVHRLLRHILAVAVDEGRLVQNPAARIGLPRLARREIKPLTMRQVIALSDQVEPRYHALILLLASCGLRIGEAAALRVKRVDLMRRRLEITAAYAEVGGELVLKETKTGKPRAVMLPTFLVDELRDHLARFSDPRDPEALVFTAPHGGPPNSWKPDPKRPRISRRSKGVKGLALRL